MAPGNTIPFNLPGFKVVQVDECANTLIVQAVSIASDSRCPYCGYTSTQVHSYYTRSPRDLPCSDRQLCLRLKVRRFRCRNESCERRTFVERIPQVVPVHGQRTVRFTTAVRALAVELSAEAGARVTRHLQMAVSADTLLRILRRSPPKPISKPRVVGVDDWAFRKGRRYGTIVVDLERQRVLDLLPDRTAATLATWLKSHPSIEIISRDRAGAYAEGASAGAPDAIQVADRWHLLKNLREALALSYQRHQSLLRQVLVDAKDHSIKPLGVLSTPKLVSRAPQNTPATGKPKTLSPAEQARQQRRQYWEHKFAQVHALHDQGLPLRAIARELELNIGTVRKYSRLSELPIRTAGKRGPRVSIVVPYRAYLCERLTTENQSSRQLWRELQAQGFRGGHTVVYRYMVQLRQELGLPPTPRSVAAPRPAITRLTARLLASLVISRLDQLSASQQLLITQAEQLHPDIQLATQLARRFATMLRTRTVGLLPKWMHEVAASPFPSLVSFVRGIQRDYAAVTAAFCLPWSNELIAYCTSFAH